MRSLKFFLLAFLIFCPLVPQAFSTEPSREAAVKQILNEWQAKQPRAFQCSYTRWDYDLNFGIKENDFLVSEATGRWQVFSPNSWEFQIVATKAFDSAKDRFVPIAGSRDQWMCDGQAYFRFDFRKQTLHEYVPPASKPQPSLFSVLSWAWVLGEQSCWITDPQFIRDRATVKVSTPASAQAEIWLEIGPTEQRDIKVFEKLDLILDARDFRTKGVQFHSSGGRIRMVYVFAPLAEPPLVETLFPPATPAGWKRVVETSAK